MKRIDKGFFKGAHLMISLAIHYRFDDSSFTPARTLSISGLKSRVLKLPFFNLKMMMKNGLDFFFEIHRAPSEIPANLPGQFSLSGQIFLHWEAATLRRLGEF